VTGAEVVVEPDEAAGSIRVLVTVRAKDRTGAEMEALTGAAVAALSLYDTTKEFDRAARIDAAVCARTDHLRRAFHYARPRDARHTNGFSR